MNEHELFAAALEIGAPDERSAYLDRACGGDDALRGRIEALLRAHEQAGSFLAAPTLAGSATMEVPRSLEGPGTVVGPYKLLQSIGEGGMGTVYMAEQTQPVKRLVALKVIKAGMDTRSVLARFGAERQALALMDHPNIARVLDAGATETGRPYFVMELVKGVPITQYCDDRRLTLRERLELFVPVCQAVQHAHQKGVIHRDLKPSNILVAQYDGRPVPKVIDFGVAKATGSRLTEQTLYTEFGSVVGTLEYMSPEQAELNQLDIDTRSDVYSLGAILYELLTGSTPLGRERLGTSAFLEMLRVIREEDSPRPSARLSTTEELPSIAACRQVEPRKLSRLVRGELDWIVMKALEKDRNRRYETANGLAHDIQRYLADEPVLACPPSGWYRFGKFARRNRAALITASAVMASLTVGTAAATWQAVLAQRAMATTAIEKERADKKADTAARISMSLQQMLGLLDPDFDKGPGYTVLQLLDDYANNLEKELADQPEAAAELHAAVGRAYACRGQRDQARKHLDRALSLCGTALGDQHEKYADVLVDYARPDALPSQPGLPEPEAAVRRALDIYRARGVGGEPVIKALWTLHWIVGSGSADRTEPILEAAIREANRSPGVVFAKLPSIYHALARVRVGQSRFAEAEKIARQAVAMHLELHKGSLETGWSYFILGEALRPQAKFAEALAAEDQALTILRRGLPPESAAIAFALNAVRRTLEAAEKNGVLADVFPSLTGLSEWQSLFQQIVTTTNPGDHDYSDPVQEAVLGLVTLSRFCRQHGDQWAAASDMERGEAARSQATHILEQLEAQLAKHPERRDDDTAYALVALFKAGQPERALGFGRKLLNMDTPRRDLIASSVAWFLATAEVPSRPDPNLAIQLAKKAVAAKPSSSLRHNRLGVALYRADNFKLAISELEKDVELSTGGTSFSFYFLAMAHWRLGNKDQARSWYDRAVRWMEDHEAQNEELHRFRAEAAGLLGVKGE